MRGLRKLAFITVCALGGAAPALPESAAKRAHEDLAWRTEAAKALEARGDERSRVAAAVVLSSTLVPDQTALASAVKLIDAGNEARLAENPAWSAMRIRVCEQSKSCDVLGLAATVRWLDADNAAAWLPNLAAGYADKDEQVIDRVLADMGQGKRFALYVDATGATMLDALTAAHAPASSSKSPSLWEQVNDVHGIYMPFAVPSPVPALRVCTQSAASATRRDSCLKTAALMQQGDSVLFQIFGLLIQRHFALPDPRTVHSLTERRRTLDWRQQQFAQSMHAFLPWSRKKIAEAFAALLRRHPRQEDFITAFLREARVPAEPPTNASHR